MSLTNKLNKLSDKIDYYSIVLNKKTESINDTPYKNKKTKLAKWNKCKGKLIKELNIIDSKLNRFIKDSNNCISHLKSHNKLMRFGSETDGEYESEYDSDPEETPADLSVDVPVRTSVEEPIINVRNKFIEIVEREQDINVKVYKCLYYGTFWKNFPYDYIHPYTSDYGFTIIESAYVRLLERSKNITDALMTALNKNNAYLAGGYINMAVNYPEYNISSDIDIYINKKNFKQFYEEIKRVLDIHDITFDISSPYMESFFKKNGLLSRFNIKLYRSHIDILIIRDDYNIKDVIKNFDLTYCSVYLDPTDFKIKGNVEDMINKSGKLNDEYAQNYLFNKFIQNRIKKYKNRGYKTHIDTNIDIVIEPKKPKNITNGVMVHKLLQRMYKNYKNLISTSELTFILSILEYSKKNVIKCAKKIATIVYSNEQYYYYVLINECSEFLNEIDKEFYDRLILRPTLNENLHKLIKLFEGFKDELINTARENNETIYTKKPSNNSELIKILTDTTVTGSLKIVDSNYNLTINQFNDLLNLSRENPELTIQQLFLKSSNELISNPAYINTILTIINNFAEPGNQIFNNEWFTQKKFFIASMENLEYFQLEVKEYLRSEIDFREIMYYDLFEAEEKSYDEVYEDSDNLLFVLEDTKTGFTYTFDTLTNNDLQEFILECTQDVLSAPTLRQIKNKNRWYNQISSPYNIGILTSQLYQAYSLYENSDKKIRKFIISSPQQFQHVSSIKAIQWSLTPGMNIWDEHINLVSETHCGIGMKVYDKISYSE